MYNLPYLYCLDKNLFGVYLARVTRFHLFASQESLLVLWSLCPEMRRSAPPCTMVSQRRRPLRWRHHWSRSTTVTWSKKRMVELLGGSASYSCMLFHDVSCSIMWLFKVTSWSVSLHRSSKHPHDFCSWLWRHLHVKFWPIQSCAEKATSNGTQKISGLVDDSSCFPSLSSLCIFSGCWSKAPDSVGKF